MFDTRNAKSIVIVAGLAALSLALATPSTAQAQNASSSANSSSAAPQSQSSAPSNAAAPQDALAAAARKAKEQKSQTTKPAKVFTNDNLPTTGISTVGATPSTDSSDASASTSAAPPSGQGERYWRDKFASLNKKLEQDQGELDVMQRELGQLNLQNYSDPVQAMQQGYSRSDIQKKTDDISTMQKNIDADKQAIDDAEDDLRKAGGDPGWAR
jgi:hypothetical protein